MSEGAMLFAGVAAAAWAAIGTRRRVKTQRKNLTGCRFDRSASEISADADKLLAYITGVYDKIAAVPLDEVTFENTIGEFLKLEEDTDTWGTNVTFLKHVSTDKAVRDACVEAGSKLSQASVTLNMRVDVYQRVKAYADTHPELEGEEKRFLEHTMRDYRRLGLSLDEATREELEALKKECKKLETEYHSNLAEEKRVCWFTREQLAGVPPSVVESLRQEGGKYEVTMAYPHVIPLLDHCSVGSTRKEVATTFGQRGMPRNTEIMESLVVLRCKIAKLAGYASHADYRLEVEMAKSPTTVLPFLQKLNQGLQPIIEAERAELKKLKLEEEGTDEFCAWDARYYLRKDKEAKYKLDNMKIAEYFPLQVVTEGMLDIYQRLLGLTFTEISTPHVWHEDVSMYQVDDKESGALMGYFYLDLFPRDGKYGHACCCPMQKGYGRDAEGKRKSVAAAGMLANFTKPTASSPSLLQHSEVVTFFHEFGHVMHHICSWTETAAFASFDVETDFVEAPSQNLENWCWEAETLKMMSGHYKDHSKKLPDDLAESLAASKLAHVGHFNRRQIQFGMFDQTIHGITEPERVDTEALYRKLHEETYLVPPPEGTNIAASFAHLAGGYDSKYYGYMWSEVFSMDMFASRFQKEGLLNPETGMSYRKCILEVGGSRDAMDSLKEFLGREPNDKAFLISKGL